jgi:hypothetical protein
MASSGGQRAVVQAAEERRQSGRNRATAVLPYRSRTRPGIWRGVNDGREDRISRWGTIRRMSGRGAAGIGRGRPVA